jgi:hypothetical protein
MDMFEEIIGYKSLSFIANCYIWDETSEKVLSQLGVKYFQGISNQFIPHIDMNVNHSLKYKKHYFGQKNKFGQRYFLRNVFFEPSLYSKIDFVDDCLQHIDISFKCKKPAIVGSHRLNYISFIDENNRKKNLGQLRIFFNTIVKKWQSVEFVSTVELDNIF